MGRFCEILEKTPRNLVIEFLLEMRGLDFSIGDIAKNISLNRATTYNVMKEFIKKKWVVSTRKVSGSNMYKLNTNNKDVKVLIKIFDLILREVSTTNKK